MVFIFFLLNSIFTQTNFSDKINNFWRSDKMAEKSFKYIILGGGVSAVSIFFLSPKIMEFRFSVITSEFFGKSLFRSVLR